MTRHDQAIEAAARVLLDASAPAYVDGPLQCRVCGWMSGEHSQYCPWVALKRALEDAPRSALPRTDLVSRAGVREIVLRLSVRVDPRRPSSWLESPDKVLAAIDALPSASAPAWTEERLVQAILDGVKREGNQGDIEDIALLAARIFLRGPEPAAVCVHCGGKGFRFIGVGDPIVTTKEACPYCAKAAVCGTCGGEGYVYIKNYAFTDRTDKVPCPACAPADEGGKR